MKDYLVTCKLYIKQIPHSTLLIIKLIDSLISIKDRESTSSWLLISLPMASLLFLCSPAIIAITAYKYMQRDKIRIWNKLKTGSDAISDVTSNGEENEPKFKKV